MNDHYFIVEWKYPNGLRVIDSETLEKNKSKCKVLSAFTSKSDAKKELKNNFQKYLDLC